MKIVANEVGVFRCQYQGIKSCKNPDYFMLMLRFEVEVMDEIKNWDSLPQTQYLLVEASDTAKFSACQIGHIYHFKMSVSYQSANTRDGKNYPAGIKFNPLQVLGEVRQQEAA